MEWLRHGVTTHSKPVRPYQELIIWLGDLYNKNLGRREQRFRTIKQTSHMSAVQELLPGAWCMACFLTTSEQQTPMQKCVNVKQCTDKCTDKQAVSEGRRHACAKDHLGGSLARFRRYLNLLPKSLCSATLQEGQAALRWPLYKLRKLLRGFWDQSILYWVDLANNILHTCSLPWTERTYIFFLCYFSYGYCWIPSPIRFNQQGVVEDKAN